MLVLTRYTVSLDLLLKTFNAEGWRKCSSVYNISIWLNHSACNFSSYLGFRIGLTGPPSPISVQRTKWKQVRNCNLTETPGHSFFLTTIWTSSSGLGFSMAIMTCPLSLAASLSSTSMTTFGLIPFAGTESDTPTSTSMWEQPTCSFTFLAGGDFTFLAGGDFSFLEELFEIFLLSEQDFTHQLENLMWVTI